MKTPIDISGKKFNRLTALFFHHKVPLSKGWSGHRHYWVCRCDCGKKTIVAKSKLILGATKSCGCLNQELRDARNHVHGYCGSRIYRIWKTMKSRCHNPKFHSYRDYGARGITICKEWSDFRVFLSDMGKSYRDNLSIDRKNNDGNYCKENCRWATHKQQANNRRKRRWKKRPI